MKNEVNFNEQIRHVVEGKEELSPAARHSMRWLSVHESGTVYVQINKNFNSFLGNYAS